MMDIRLALREDLPTINEIYNQAVLQKFCTAHLSPVSLEERLEWFGTHDSDRYPVFVAISDHSVSGWVSLGPYRPDRQALAHVAEVSYYVDQDERKKGIGNSLMQYVIELSPRYGFSVLVAILLHRNHASIGLLEKFGFSLWGNMPGIAKIDNQLADHLYFGLKL